MRPYLVGGACHRVQQLVDSALAEGELSLPPELAAHAERCPNCGPQLRQTEQLFRRLRNAAGGVDLGPVPGVVDAVMRQIDAGPAPTVPSAEVSAEMKRRRLAHVRWVLGQLAAVAAVLVIAVGGLTFLALKVNEAVSGTRPAEVVERLTAPFQNWTQALLRRTR